MNLEPNASDALTATHLLKKKYVTYMRVSTLGANDAPAQTVLPTVEEQCAYIDEMRKSFRAAATARRRRHPRRK